MEVILKVVCFSEIQWRYVRTRKQQILSRFPDDWQILFLSSVVAGKRNNLRPERDGRVIHACVPVFKNFPQRWARAVFSVGLARALWNAFIFIWVKAILGITGFGGSERVFYVSNIYYARVLRRLHRDLMLYDCNDDPMEFPDVPSWAANYFSMLASDADITVAVSGELQRRLGEMGIKNVRRVGNGVDYELFSRAAAAGAPDEMIPIKRPVLGYSGAIAQWFDIDLLEKLADRFPEASLVLLGPIIGERQKDLERISASRGNIHYLGSKPYERLGAYIASMDVCLIPLKINRLMRFADPNKIYEYAAAGKPVVTMKFSRDMDELDGIVYLSETSEEFIDNVRIALTEGADGDKLRKFAKRSSWQSRADEMAGLIRAGIKGGNAT